MQKVVVLFILFFAVLDAHSQDVIERSYFPGAQAKNAAIAAARYAEEGYYYTKFTTYISAVDSSRMFADTALFFVKRALMLGDTSLVYAPPSNIDAVKFLNSGKMKTFTGDSIIREFYPMSSIKSHHVFGTEASFHLSNAVMDFFNASLLLTVEDSVPDSENERYEVLPFDDEIKRLEADETSFQHAANAFESEIAMLENLVADVNAEISKAADQQSRFKLRTWLDDINVELHESTEGLKKTSFRIQEIRYLLDKKYLEDVRDVETPDHVSKFETDSGPGADVEMDKEVPDGLIYKIQLGYYPDNVDVDNFHGLFPITGETVRTDLARFYAGLFFSYKDASKGNMYVRKNAIPNAFIVPFHNGEKISVSRAVEIERARGIK